MYKYRFTSFDSDDFYKAIEEKKYAKLKTCVISAVRNNPEFRFATGQKESEARLAWRILEENVPEIFEKYEAQDGDQLYNENSVDKWDREFFIRQTFLLGENFSKERLKHVWNIGRKISRGIVPNFQDPQELNLEMFEEQEIKSTVQKTSAKMNPLLLGGIVLLAAIVLVVIVMGMK